MTTTDPIADLLTRIRNAQLAGRSDTSAPHSKLKEAICKVLKDRKFIEDYSVDKSGTFPELNVEFSALKANLELKRVSKPGQRIYINKGEMPRVKNGLGIAIISTPKGVMTGMSAKKAGIGGELLCTVS
ncbi:30S ribosomal protein S8 [Candidatus Peregrinibacteria bacterium]|jgi:small subunit ribosomal protein S8|nr:30S ribosomal protein S8 [Candidatus Peregrinibacteria bacterium]